MFLYSWAKLGLLLSVMMCRFALLLRSVQLWDGRETLTPSLPTLLLLQLVLILADGEWLSE